MPRKALILILGMGRSGTSALARVLSLCGCSLPELLLGAGDSNPKGHWEPIDALAVNDEFLFRHGSTWYDPTLHLQCELAVDEAEKAGYIERIRAFLSACPMAHTLVIKEPRITGLLPFWLKAAEQAELPVKTVIPIRRPQESAASLSTRDGTSLELATTLWLKYNLLAEHNTRGLPRVFVEYSNLLNDWRIEIARVASTLALELAPHNDSEIDGFLSRDLHRQRSVALQSEIFGFPWISTAYTILSRAARDEPIDLQTLDNIYHTFSACERTFRVSLDEFRGRFGPGATFHL